ncbi:galactose-3-O-sulfotransferase 2-like [Rhinatrema bivittatum]|uniref:galactose-3-O-sulfotransferase 2-like n=1 Tax=Rhinatrema bivittatum TaxID=194408 RepID=UPI0011288054|nr:galactose-3-O-sulfotransferase 2-like [Rhinatrema bivittatum]
MFRRMRLKIIRKLLKMLHSQGIHLWSFLIIIGIVTYTLQINGILQQNGINNSSKNDAITNTLLIQRLTRTGAAKANKDNSKLTNAQLQKYGMALQEKLTDSRSTEVSDIQSKSFLSTSSTHPDCKLQTHIVFLKMHKSASSTVMNILFRFGEAQNLMFAFPIKRESRWFYPDYFSASYVQGFSPYKKNKFDIMLHHMRFQRSEIEKVMPDDSFYFSILRNPVHLMESSFSYFTEAQAFQKARTLDKFLDQPLQFYNASDEHSGLVKNLMTFDFGFNHNGNSSAKDAQLNIEAIENMFDLILIAEYFDESMILLKEALCWNLDDVVYFRLNSRSNRRRTPLSKNTIEKIKSWNKLDWELYIHFNRTFWERIDQTIGRERMQQEVKKLHKRREELARTCLQGEGMTDPQQIKDLLLAPYQHGRARILGYNLKPGLDKVTKEQCIRLIIPELQYSQLLYYKQFSIKKKFRNA